VPVLTLNHGTAMPVLGLGVFQSAPEETAQAVEAALLAGRRLVDPSGAARHGAWTCVNSGTKVK
jgi:diketogulonate reductase-like aldo/keto reductase